MSATFFPARADQRSGDPGPRLGEDKPSAPCGSSSMRELAIFLTVALLALSAITMPFLVMYAVVWP